jgi:1-aminocyclopropane-1-carboxylate deaminase/D-cysteine desulfhydrase-like pyridoxal-dependent ACC family enzyme
MKSNVLIPTYESLKSNEITPIEEYNGIIYKREDKYLPFEDVPISGGKVRQALSLILNNCDKIKNNCDGLVATATSVNSPQGIVVSRAAKEFGFDSIIVFGATKQETLMRNIMVKWILDSGAKIDYECKIAYDNALNSRINQIQSARKLFHIKFGINLESNPDAIINSIANQVQNIPNDLDNLIIPTGSAITAGGILCGLEQYNIKPKRVIIVQIAGYDRRETLHKIFRILNVRHPEYEYVADKTYPYSKNLYIKLNDTEMLDPVYEAKAYEWMIKHINYRNEKTLFWLVGNSFYVRTLTPQMLRE